MHSSSPGISIGIFSKLFSNEGLLLIHVLYPLSEDVHITIMFFSFAIVSMKPLMSSSGMLFLYDVLRESMKNIYSPFCFASLTIESIRVSNVPPAYNVLKSTCNNVFLRNGLGTLPSLIRFAKFLTVLVLPIPSLPTIITLFLLRLESVLNMLSYIFLLQTTPSIWVFFAS